MFKEGMTAVVVRDLGKIILLCSEGTINNRLKNMSVLFRVLRSLKYLKFGILFSSVRY